MRKKKRDRVRDTYVLERAEGGTCQIKERKRPSEGHSLSGDGRGGGGGTCQDTDRKRPSEGHSLPGDGRGRDLSGQRKEVTRTERGALTS